MRTRHQDWLFHQPTGRLAHLLRGIDGIEKTIPQARAMIVRERGAIVAEAARRLYPTCETLILADGKRKGILIRLFLAVFHTAKHEWKIVALVAIPSAITIYGAGIISGIIQ